MLKKIERLGGQMYEADTEGKVRFRYCPQCRRYSWMIRLNDGWMCSECGYTKEDKVVRITERRDNNEPNR
ncbi:MAG: hypothetical protein ACUVTR_02175 [Dehalococcoidia bacterium]